jgi:hypothetical protein
VTSPGRTVEPHPTDLDHAHWHTSSFSNGGEQCVQATNLPDGGTAIRDSKSPTHATLRYTAGPWTAFCAITSSDMPKHLPTV